MTGFQGKGEGGSEPPSGLVGCRARRAWSQPRAGMSAVPSCLARSGRGGSSVELERGVCPGVCPGRRRGVCPGLRPFSSLFIFFNRRTVENKKRGMSNDSLLILRFFPFFFTSLSLSFSLFVLSFLFFLVFRTDHNIFTQLALHHFICVCVCVCVCVCIARHISASKMPELTRNAFDSINFLVIN